MTCADSKWSAPDDDEYAAEVAQAAVARTVARVMVPGNAGGRSGDSGGRALRYHTGGHSGQNTV